MLFRSRIKTAASTPFSEFIRNASSAEKKRVYERVLKKASERQNRLLREFAVSGQPAPAGFAVNEAETHRTTRARPWRRWKRPDCSGKSPAAPGANFIWPSPFWR